MEELINSKAKLKEWLNYEKNKYNPHICFFLEMTDNDILYKFIWILRHYEYHLNTRHKLLSVIWKIRFYKYCNKYGLQIGPNCCGKGFHIMHLGSILINKNVKIGSDCSIHINTALVANGVDSCSPHLGNNVVIGVNSVICGDVHLGDNSVVGASSFVNKSFPDGNVTVAGVPATIISLNTSAAWNKKNINYTL